MKFFNNLLFVSLTVLNFFCRDTDTTQKELLFVQSFPKGKNHTNFLPFKIVQKRTNEANLNPIHLGFDSIFIRIWYVYRNKIQITDLVNKDGSWNAEYHALDLGLIDERLVVLRTKSYALHPKSSLPKIYSALVSYGIVTLPDKLEIPKYSVDADGTFVIVELATKYKYRIYSYINPVMNLRFPEAANMERIMELIENELGVKRNHVF